MNIKVSFGASNQVMKTTFGTEIRVNDFDPNGYQPYLGTYEITPTVEGMTLETKKKFMKDDLTVKAIPVFQTSNAADGDTVYIASEIETE